jgi:2-polyprenyl-6-methoxyphenol hydroxylase-like FAD-dependent oxidoreductase
MRADVVVVGGGPVGLLAAVELAGFGVDTVLFEELAEPSERPKASTVHARAVQSLVRRDRVPWISPLHQPEEVVRRFHFAGVPGVNLTAPGSEPEPLLKIAQIQLERSFETQAAAAGVRILRGHTVTALDQGPDLVRVEAKGPTGRVHCEAAYVIGADGARSTVRTLAEIEAETWPATVFSLIGLVALPDPAALGPGWHRTPRGWIVATPVGDGDVNLRTLGAPPGPIDRTQAPTADQLGRAVEWIVGREVALERPRWLSRFSDFARLARGYRLGRVLLAGDAAHMHFPIGGQGLTAGILDVINLCWKLAHVVRGTAPADLLDSYDTERRPAARRVIESARAQVVLMRPDSELAAIHTLLAERLADPRIGAALSRMISGQDIVLPPRTARPSTFEGRFLTNRRLATSRGRIDVISLLQSGRDRPLLLLIGRKADRFRSEAAPWARLLHIVAADAEPDSPYEAVLVRPDGYIAWAADGGTLTEALAGLFGPQTPGSAA